ncbi:hypothetical protein J6P52_04115 [bacterium]|nr:hypothetical protein [bacterium]
MNRDNNDFEYRSTMKNTNEILNIMQGQSVNKEVTDSNYYKGDRYIVQENPMLQIHNIILKNDVVDNNNVIYQKDDYIVMIALLFPDKDYKKTLIKRKEFI